MNNVINTREICKADYPLLNDFIYHSIFMLPGAEPLSREIIFNPGIFVYIENFGEQQGDYGVVAECDGTIIGIAWTRIIPAYGHVDENAPELAISVLPEHRGIGIGTMLMEHLFELLGKHGYKQISLSVQQDNPAARFYQQLGYEIIRENTDFAGNMDYIMVKTLG